MTKIMSSRELDRSLKTTFDPIASEYDAIRPTYPEAAIDAILAYSGANKKSKILEIACGTGQATQFFLKKELSIHAIDIGQELLKIAAEKFSDNPRFSFENIPFEQYAADSSSLDLIYCATAFH